MSEQNRTTEESTLPWRYVTEYLTTNNHLHFLATCLSASIIRCHGTYTRHKHLHLLCCSGQRDGAAPGAGAEDVHLRAGALQGAQGAEGGPGQGGPRPRQGDGGAQGQDSADGENSQVSHGYKLCGYLQYLHRYLQYLHCRDGFVFAAAEPGLPRCRLASSSCITSLHIHPREETRSACI